MDHLVHVLNVVFFATGANVPLTVPVAPNEAVVGGDEEVVPNVEFPAVVEKRLYVLLHD